MRHQDVRFYPNILSGLYPGFSRRAGEELFGQCHFKTQLLPCRAYLQGRNPPTAGIARCRKARSDLKLPEPGADFNRKCPISAAARDWPGEGRPRHKRPIDACESAGGAGALAANPNSAARRVFDSTPHIAGIQLAQQIKARLHHGLGPAKDHHRLHALAELQQPSTKQIRYKALTPARPIIGGQVYASQPLKLLKIKKVSGGSSPQEECQLVSTVKQFRHFVERGDSCSAAHQGHSPVLKRRKGPSIRSTKQDLSSNRNLGKVPCKSAHLFNDHALLFG